MIPWIDEIFCGRVLYEIVFDKELFIHEYTVENYEIYGDYIYFSNKCVGRSLIDENLINSVFFFSLKEAERRLADF